MQILNIIFDRVSPWRRKLSDYIGFKENKRPELLESNTVPTKETHPQYDFIYVPFRTNDDASKYVKAMTGLACGEG